MRSSQSASIPSRVCGRNTDTPGDWRCNGMTTESCEEMKREYALDARRERGVAFEQYQQYARTSVRFRLLRRTVFCCAVSFLICLIFPHDSGVPYGTYTGQKAFELFVAPFVRFGVIAACLWLGLALIPPGIGLLIRIILMRTRSTPGLRVFEISNGQVSLSVSDGLVSWKASALTSVSETGAAVHLWKGKTIVMSLPKPEFSKGEIESELLQQKNEVPPKLPSVE